MPRRERVCWGSAFLLITTCQSEHVEDLGKQQVPRQATHDKVDYTKRDTKYCASTYFNIIVETQYFVSLFYIPTTLNRQPTTINYCTLFSDRSIPCGAPSILHTSGKSGLLSIQILVLPLAVVA